MVTLGPKYKSLDLNPIEKILDILTHEVYKNGQQYDSTKELKVALKRALYYYIMIASLLVFKFPSSNLE